jgi:hypothetical protein
VLYRSLSFTPQVEDSFCVFVEQLTWGRELMAVAVVSLKERSAQLVFQFFQSDADGGSRSEDALCSPGYVSFFNDRREHL